jgi:spore germination protein KA
MQVLTYQGSPFQEGFILRENSFDNRAAEEAGMDNGSEGEGGGDAASSQDRRRPRSLRKKKNKDTEEKDIPGQGKISTRLARNREIIECIYGLPANKDIIIRDFSTGTVPPVKSFLVFIDGMASRADLNFLLQNLMLEAREISADASASAISVLHSLLPGGQASLQDSFDKIVASINYGDTAIFIEGSPSALVVETKGWEHRPVERPNTEQTITGPQESFIENLRANTALVRKIIRSEKLYTELISVGRRFHSDVAVMYISDLANPDLVQEVKRRIASINVDYVTDSGMLEQFIEDSPYNLNPQTLYTERPDRVAASLAEGKVAIFLSGSPYALVVPTTMYTLLHSGEESYLRWQYGTFLRYTRTVSFYLALLLPGAYLAAVLYHQEMIPTDLLLAIAGNRERVPFPTVVEMLLMEFSFELVREAGLRIPSIIGSTIGIVGALILGQAAVQANLVSPVVVIMVAVTGLASFSIPSFSLAFAVRTYRFFYIIMGAILGFYGITIALFVQILLTTNLKSFGVPYLSPTGPRTYPGGDVVNRLPIFLQRRRPDYLNPQEDTRAPREPRGWVRKRGDVEGDGKQE